MGKVFCYGCHTEFVRIAAHWAANRLCHLECLQQRHQKAQILTDDARLGTLVGPQSVDGDYAHLPSSDDDEIGCSDDEVVPSVRTSSRIHQRRLQEEQTVMSIRRPSAGGMI